MSQHLQPLHVLFGICVAITCYTFVIWYVMERPLFRVPTIYLTSFTDEKTRNLLAEWQGKPPNIKSPSRLCKSMLRVRYICVPACACVRTIRVGLKVALVRHLVFFFRLRVKSCKSSPTHYYVIANLGMRKCPPINCMVSYGLVTLPNSLPELT